jgi:sugar-specific transcriptional regulator TrmB
MSDERVVRLLQLGVSQRQARIYELLLHSGIMNVRDISRITQIARTDVYATLVVLQKKGMVEPIFASPQKHKAVPIELVVSNLLDRKNKEFDEYKNNAKLLLKEWKEIREQNSFVEPDEGHFRLVPSSSVISERKKIINASRENIKMILDFNAFYKHFETFLYIIKLAINRKVRIKIITDSTLDKEEAIISYFVAEELDKSSCFSIKNLPASKLASLTLFDNRIVLLSTMAKASLTKSPELWSNDVGIVHIANTYFDLNWEKAHILVLEKRNH